MTFPKASIFLLALLFAWTALGHPTEYVEGDVIVTFKASADLATAQQKLGNHSLNFSKHFPQLSEHRKRQTGLVQDKTRTTAQLIEELQQDPTVETAEPNYLRWVSAVPNDTNFSFLWGLQNTAQTVNGTVGTSGVDIKYVPAWSLARSSSTQIVVAVIDTGVDYTHPDLAANMWVNTGEIPGNSVDDDANGYKDDIYGYDFASGNGDPMDSGEHGTHVAGTIAAVSNNALGVAGVCPVAKIMALKVSTDGNTMSSSGIISALQYAVTMKGRGVNIVAINASYGGGGNSSSEQAAIQAVGDAGIVFCAAAGNNASNNDTTPEYPASYRLSNMIVIAATDQKDALASFSDYGATTVDLGAPGVNIYSLMPANSSTANVIVGGTVYSGTPMTYSGHTSGTSMSIYDCGLGNTTDFPSAVKGNIALIQRGTLTFSQKVTNAMAAGARAAIIYNNVSGSFAGTLQTTGAWIPTVAISQSDGLAIKAALPTSGTIIFTYGYQFLDGTSMATPHVTGAVAFTALNFPNDTVPQRIHRILANVDSVVALSGKTVTGGRLNLQRIVDSNLNGLPDWWEQSYFGYLGVNPNADSDYTGMTNLQKFLAGLDPTNPQSRFAVSAPVKNPVGNGVVITWSCEPGKTYQVYYSDTLVSGSWKQDLPNSQITAATGQFSLSYTDTSATGVSKRFYHIQLVVP